MKQKEPNGFRGFRDSGGIVLYTEVTTSCQNRCRICAIDKVDRKGFIDESVKTKVAKLISSLPDLRFRVFFHIVGEPLLYDGLEDYIKRLSLPNAQIWIATNGILLTDDRIKRLYSSGLRNIWFSFFLTNKDGYNSFTRTNNHFATVKENLLNLLSKSNLFENIHIATFSDNIDHLDSLTKNKNNITIEHSRGIINWSYTPGSRSKFICISLDGKVNFHWEDYNFDISIGNIKDLDPDTIIKEYQREK